MSSNPDDELEPGQQFGRTIGLTHSGDLAETTLHRPQQIYDVDAVIQDLKVELLTPEGTDPFRPEFGLNQFEAIGTSDARFKAEIARTIGPSADQRVERVDSITIDRQGGNRNNVDVHVELTLTDGTIADFTFPVQRTTVTPDPVQRSDPQ